MQRLLLVLVLFAGCGEDASVLAPCSTSADCAPLANGDPCSGRFACESGSCRFDPTSVVACDPANDTPCTRNRCDPLTGACAMGGVREGLPCDDGEPCTVGDACAKGACAAGAVDVCDCRKTSDCADDGDACNGTPLCDTSAFPHRCVANPASVVTCNEDEDPCTAAACDPKSGACTQSPVADGGACDDGDACTSGDTCQGGSCAGGTDVCKCSSDSDCADDGDKCNGVPFCDSGACKPNPATVVTCSGKANTACRKNLCLPATGSCALTSVKDESPCDDGQACTKNDACIGGVCLGGTDVCKCSADSDCADDGDKCNGLPYCDKATGGCAVNPATAVVCPTAGDSECAKTVCLPQTGACTQLPRAAVQAKGCVQVDLGGGVKGTQCLWLPAGATSTASFACDDGDPCTSGEVCAGKQCQGGTVLCECDHDSDCGSKDDGDLCNGVWYCDKALGTCKPNPASKVFCSKKDDTACLAAACDPKSGGCALQPAPATTGCDDGSACTAKDSCDGKGACAGAQVDCGDKDPCTIDSCEPAKGCLHVAKVCSDGNDCTAEACDLKTGQCAPPAPRKQGAACNADNDGCTVGDACNGKGTCVVGGPAVCNDPGKACKQRVCASQGASQFQCVEVNADDGSNCDTAKGCWQGSSCAKGVCVTGGTSRLFAAAVGPSGQDTWLNGGAGLAGGGVVVAGGKGLGGGKVGWWVAGTDPLGKVLWTSTGDTGVAGPKTEAVAALAEGADAWVLGTRGLAGAGQTEARLLRYSASGKVLLNVGYGMGAFKETWAGALGRHPQGHLWVAASYPKVYKGVKTRTTWLRKVNVKGGVLGEASYLPGATQVPTDVDGTKSDDALLVQVHTLAGMQRARWTLRNPLKVAAMTADHVDHTLEVQAVSAAQLSDGFAMSWQRRDAPKGAWQGRMSLHRDNGDKRRTFSLGDGALPHRVVRHAAGVLAVGTTAQGKAWVGRFDAALNAVGSHTLDQAGVLRGAVARATGGAWLFGEETVGAKRRAYLVRIDDWGHTACGDAGGCGGKTQADCDDAKRCTRDDCAPALGCQHEAMDAGWCDPEDGCAAAGACAAGACKPSAAGLRFVYGSGASSTTVDAASTRRLASGAWRMVTAWKYDGYVFDQELTHQGAYKGGAAYKRCGGHVAEVAGLSQQPGAKRLWVLGSGTKGDARWCLAESGVSVEKATWPCAGCKASAVELETGWDGTRFIVVQVAGQGARVLRRGAKQWTSPVLSPTGRVVVAPREASLADLSTAVVGRAVSKSGAGDAAWIARVSEAGKLLWQVTDPGDAGRAFLDVDQASDGSLFAAGYNRINGSVDRERLARYSDAGKLLWQSVGTIAPNSGRSAAVVALPGGQVAFAGFSWDQGAKATWLRGVGLDGETRWHEALVGNRWPIPGGLRPEGDFLVLNGKQLKSGATRVWVAVTSHWGHASCVGSGVCSAKTFDDCDDGKACTVDWCDSAKGCRHAPLDQVGCGGGKSCAKGVCL